MLSACGILILLPFATGDFHQFGISSLLKIPWNASSLGISRFPRDGEFERITAWPGLCARETSIDWGEFDVTLREVWLKEEKRKLHLIYEGGALSNCFDEKIELAAAAAAAAAAEGNDVTEECLAELNLMGSGKNGAEEQDNENGTRVMPRVHFTPQNIGDWFVSIDALRDQCLRVRTRMKNQVLMQQEQSRNKRGIFTDFLFAPGTKWCGPTQLASSYNELGASDQLDRCCRRHDHCQRAIPPMTQRYALYNHMPFTLSHCGCDQRQYEVVQVGGMDKSKRRRIRGRARGRGKRDLLLIPGTQWCGRGHRATKYTNLGGFGVADACCRRHDTTCPFFIPAFHTKYNLFNWGVSTLMHCACDERSMFPGSHRPVEISADALIAFKRHSYPTITCYDYLRAGKKFKISYICSRVTIFPKPNTISAPTIVVCFRTCLKMAGTPSANFVGKLFFNVVQTKCFVLKPQKTCLRRSWWGKCELHEYRKQAHLRENVQY